MVSPEPPEMKRQSETVRLREEKVGDRKNAAPRKFNPRPDANRLPKESATGLCGR